MPTGLAVCQGNRSGAGGRRSRRHGDLDRLAAGGVSFLS
jgi:hypothetical protein